MPEQIKAGTHKRARNRVLLVDDEEQIRLFARHALEDEGLLVDTADCGRNAIDLAMQNRPALVILDVMLPDMNGQAVAHRLRAIHGEELPILVITAGGHAKEIAKTIGGFAYLQKPFDLDRLVSLILEKLSSL